MPGKRLSELATLVGGTVRGDGSSIITGAAPLGAAGPGDISFAAGNKHVGLLSKARASAVVVRSAGGAPEGLNLIIAENPELAFARILGVLRPQALPLPGVHPGAEVHPGAKLGARVSIQAFAVVEDGASVGDRTVLFPGVYVGRGAEIGPDCVIYPGVAIRENCRIGARVIIHCNSVIGSDGFGYARDKAKYVKMPQAGMVRIGDDVEIGACVTIDRATMGETVIGRGTKIDNLVQIAHNVKVGEDTVIVAQAGIAGSATVGSRVQIGGQSGVNGHISIGDDVGIGARSGVAQDVPPRSIYTGYPAIPHTDWLRAQNVYSKLPELKKKIAELEKRIAGLEADKAEKE
ncbi:MAG: UDP-3-O-(3-hydroxymyristoyl)glucosamine N-acyltransferase [Candidatus Methylomirabilis sp.]|nr:UDP-3-O-(3-hydroxymyristoyl)glucosamine N-acyltransferase [Deltaproteobacteria bacterium]